MLNSTQIIGSIAAIVSLVQFGVYIKDVLQRKTHPYAFSWFVWGLPTGIIFAAQWVNGAGAGSWATAITAILCTLIFILSLFYGEKEITLLDASSLGIALLAIILWLLIKQPLLSVILITVTDTAGFIPTIRKSIKKPHEETLSSYLLGGLKWGLSLFALSHLSLVTWLYPAVMIIANWGVVGVLIVRRMLLADMYK